jgi:hypothetical protein
VVKGTLITILATTTSEKVATGLLQMAKLTSIAFLTALRTKEEFARSLFVTVGTGIALIATTLPS